MTAITHSAACIAFQASADEYDRLNLNYCQGCQGYGMFTQHATYWEPENSEPCEDCVCQGKCPRCGHYHSDENWNQDDWDPCEACGFAFDGSGRPEPECQCGADW